MTDRLAKTLSRQEAKEMTRRRLLAKSLELLDREGEGALTPSAVARAAGVAQSTFYVHFRDKDDLLQELADWLTVGRNRAVRQARRDADSAPGHADSIREAFRVPLESMVAQPWIFRISARVGYDRSPLGRSLRHAQQQDREALVEDLIRYGYPYGTAAERHIVEIVADAFRALVPSLSAGVLEGRYSIDEALDVIMRMVSGLKPLLDCS